jgi:muconolactone delta-isomerase
VKILALEKDPPGIPDEAFTELLLREEAERVWELTQSGVIREAYFRADRETAVLVLECAGVEEAQDLLAKLPLVREKLVGFELIPLVAYPGFQRLFARGR